MTHMGIYLSDSDAEKKLAASTAGFILAVATDEEECARYLEELASSLYSGKIGSSLVERIKFNLPEIKNIKTDNLYPQTNDEITPNLFSEIAVELSNHFSPSAKRGAVNTPFQLAYDMAALSAATKLSYKLSISLQDAYVQIKSMNLSEEAKNLLGDLSWHDPCVGTGVFPLAIISLLNDLKIYKNPEAVLNKITGNDIDRIAISAGKARIAYFLASADISYTKLLTKLNKQLSVGDALQNNAQQTTLISDGRSYVDIVIGNPPYVRADRLGQESKRQLNKQYPSLYSGATDLYVYFIANGLGSIKENGLVCFVSPAHFLRSKYGKNIRTLIDQEATLEVFFDFNELPVFKDVSSHICVYALSNSVKHKSTKTHLFTSLPEKDYFKKALDSAIEVPRSNISPLGWNLHDYDVNKIISILEKDTVPLKAVVGNIYSGIKTGRQSVYIVRGELAEKLLQDEKSKNYLERYIAPSAIKRWRSEWNNDYILVVKKSDTVPEGSLLMDYLLDNKEKLESRDDIKDLDKWYSLRDCSYYSLFKKSKIIYPDISTKSRFSFDSSGLHITDGAFFLPTDSYYLLGLLNSSVANFYFKLRLSGLGTPGSGGRIRFKKTYVETFPVPKINSTNKDIVGTIESYTRKMVEGNEDYQNLIDNLVFKLYDINDGTRSQIEGKI